MKQNPKVLSKNVPEVFFNHGDITIKYVWNEHRDDTQLFILPREKEKNIKERRGKSPIHQAPDAKSIGQCWGDRIGDSLVHLHVRGDGLGYPTACNSWAAGHTLRNSQTTTELGFDRQEIKQLNDQDTIIETYLKTANGLEVKHELILRDGLPGVISQSTVTNQTSDSVVIENLTSFSIGKLSPFATDDMPERIKLHRFRSAWSLEGRHDSQLLEDLHLERYWGEGGVNNLRFGQVGSLPVRGFFPFIGLEDTAESVFWGAQLAWHGSWQMEISRRDDPLNLSGGLADYDFGQWAKTLHPKESFTSPPAILSCAIGDIDDLCQNLVNTQSYFAHKEPTSEHDMTIIFNEWCSTWGHPTHENVIKTATKLKETNTGIFVIDDGWATKPKGTFQCNGDWNLNSKSFPHGIGSTVQEINKLGLIAGVWFEFEVATEGNSAFDLQDHFLRRHGKIVQVGKRRYWDFRDPWTFDYLHKKVIQFLKENEFGYLKVDYNDSIGLGCDPLDDESGSLGEGLRQHLEKVKEFFTLIRNEVPGIIIENCASGGHRLEPGLVGLTSMSSFSDAHECLEIPIIAANLQRLIPTSKNQIWCVIREEDTERRLSYGLAATFLGRMALSGDLEALPESSFSLIQKAQSFYTSVSHIIRDGKPIIHQQALGKSYRRPEGWQAVVKTLSDKSELIVIVHTFANAAQEPIQIQLPASESFEIANSLSQSKAAINGNKIELTLPEDFSAEVIHLKSNTR